MQDAIIVAPNKKIYLFFYKGWTIWRVAGDKYFFEKKLENKKYTILSWREGRDLIDEGKL